ncbi:MAG: MMPL family transporter [SAR324 cluster bacterium]|nr:MMPL family transporter [SAR324 cluster bacterium]
MLLNLEALARFAEQYRNRSGQAFAGKTYSLADVIKETHQALNENRPEFYRLPGERRIIAQELLLFENSGSDDLEVLTDSQFSKARLSVKVLRDDAAAYVQLVRAIEAEAARLFRDRATVTFTGTVRLFTQTIQLSLESMGRSYLLAAGVITLLMLLLLGSVRMGLLSMIPNLGPVVVTMGLMGWVGIPLDMSNMLLGTIAIGLAVDDTIHFFHNFRSYYTLRKNAAEAIRETMLSTGRAMFFTTLVLVTGFMFFAFASLTNLIQFGILISSTLVLALLADMLLAPAMMELITRTARGRAVLERWGSAPAFEEASAMGKLAPSESPAS